MKKTKLFLLLIFSFSIWATTSCTHKEKAHNEINQSDVDSDVLGVDIQVPVSKVEASEAEKESPVSQSIDGDYATMYHSRWHSGTTSFPVTLTCYFKNADKIDYTNITPRQDGSSGLWLLYDVYAKSVGGDERLIGSFDTEKGDDFRIELLLEQPEYVKFVVNKGVGEVVSCGEIEFLKKNPANQIPEVFTDASCMELKAGVTAADIERIESKILKKLALELLDGTYDKAYRAQAYHAITEPNTTGEKLKIGSGFSLYQNVTGMYLEEGKHIITVGPLANKNVYLLLPEWMRQPTEGYEPTKDPKGWGLYSSVHKLEEGVNVINVPYSTNAYISYFDKESASAPAIKVHFVTGKVNGYFDGLTQTDEEWNKLLDNAPGPIMDAVGEFIQVAYPVEFFKKFTYGKGVELISKYDAMLLSHYTFNGFKKYDLLPENKILARVNFNYYMFRDYNGVAYLGDDNTMRMVADPEVVVKGDPCWGFSHEVGHVLQMIPQLNWGGLTEVSNNLFSLYTTIGLGNSSRLQDESKYETARKSIVESNPKISYLQDDDVFHRLVPLWQLHLYFSNNGMPDFYADLMQHLRQSESVGFGNESINNMFEFIKLSCDITQTDLTEFFDKWGFFYVGKIELDDYGKYAFNITTKQVEETKAYIASKGYAKPAVDITMIDDHTYASK